MSTTLVKFEYLGEDKDFPNAKTWKVEAIHVTTTRNKRKFTEAELKEAGASLSFRSLNINHDTDRQLLFPENATLAMRYNESKRAVMGRFRVADPTTNAMIETGRINTVSIEQIPTLGESCNEISCEQHGVAFIGMALLEADILPGDPQANIIKTEKFTASLISELIISDAQRECKECTDFVACHKCKHKGENLDASMVMCLEQVQRERPDMPMDERVVHCLEVLNRINEPAFKGLTIQLNETYKKILDDNPKSEQALTKSIAKYAPKPEFAHYFYKIVKESWEG